MAADKHASTLGYFYTKYKLFPKAFRIKFKSLTKLNIACIILSILLVGGLVAYNAYGLFAEWGSFFPAEWSPIMINIIAALAVTGFAIYAFRRGLKLIGKIEWDAKWITIIIAGIIGLGLSTTYFAIKASVTDLLVLDLLLYGGLALFGSAYIAACCVYIYDKSEDFGIFFKGIWSKIRQHYLEIISLFLGLICFAGLITISALTWSNMPFVLAMGWSLAISVITLVIFIIQLKREPKVQSSEHEHMGHTHALSIFRTFIKNTLASNLAILLSIGLGISTVFAVKLAVSNISLIKLALIGLLAFMLIHEILKFVINEVKRTDNKCGQHGNDSPGATGKKFSIAKVFGVLLGLALAIPAGICVYYLSVGEIAGDPITGNIFGITLAICYVAIVFNKTYLMFEKRNPEEGIKKGNSEEVEHKQSSANKVAKFLDVFIISAVLFVLHIVPEGAFAGMGFMRAHKGLALAVVALLIDVIIEILTDGPSMLGDEHPHAHKHGHKTPSPFMRYVSGFGKLLLVGVMVAGSFVEGFNASNELAGLMPDLATCFAILSVIICIAGFAVEYTVYGQQVESFFGTLCSGETFSDRDYNYAPKIGQEGEGGHTKKIGASP